MHPFPSVPHPAADMRETKLERQRAYVASLADSPSAPSAHTTCTEEKPVHLTIAYLLASGRTRKEISQAVGVSLSSLSSLTRQPWFIARLREITEASGKDMVKAFLEGEVITSLEVLRDIRDDSKQKGATRVTAANSILDRFLGRPTVHVESKTNLNIHSAADAKDQVQSELEKVNAELARLGVSTSTSSARN